MHTFSAAHRCGPGHFLTGERGQEPPARGLPGLAVRGRGVRVVVAVVVAEESGPSGPGSGRRCGGSRQSYLARFTTPPVLSAAHAFQSPSHRFTWRESPSFS